MVNYKEIADRDLHNLKGGEQVVALHETGHLIAMYALGLFDKFEYITIKPGAGTLGLTELNKDDLNEFGKAFTDKAARSAASPDDYQAYCKVLFEDGLHCYLPQILRHFAGGSICRHYGVGGDDLCAIDNANIKALLIPYNLGDRFSDLQAVADGFLKVVFERYEKAIKLICFNLLERKTLYKADVEKLLEDNKDSVFKWF